MKTETTCKNCEALKRKLRETSDILMRERADRFASQAAGDFGDTALRAEELYRDGEPKDELLVRIRLLPLRAKMREIEERTENIKAQRGLIDARTGQAVLNQRLTRQKIRKMELENEERNEERGAMIELYRVAVDAVERLGTGNMVEADFVVLDSLKSIGVKIPKNLKVVKQLPKQTVRA